MTIKKVIQSIEENNKYHLMMIYLYDKILERYEELNRTDPGERKELELQI